MSMPPGPNDPIPSVPDWAADPAAMYHENTCKLCGKAWHREQMLAPECSHTDAEWEAWRIAQGIPDQNYGRWTPVNAPPVPLPGGREFEEIATKIGATGRAVDVAPFEESK